MELAVEGMREPHLFLVGGILSSGKRTTSELLEYFHSSPVTMHVELACVAELNMEAVDGRIKCRQLAMDLSTCEPTPAMLQVRHASVSDSV